MLKVTVVRVIFVLSCVFFLGMAQGILVYHLQKTQTVFSKKDTSYREKFVHRKTALLLNNKTAFPKNTLFSFLELERAVYGLTFSINICPTNSFFDPIIWKIFLNEEKNIFRYLYYTAHARVSSSVGYLWKSYSSTNLLYAG